MRLIQKVPQLHKVSDNHSIKVKHFLLRRNEDNYTTLTHNQENLYYTMYVLQNLAEIKVTCKNVCHVFASVADAAVISDYSSHNEWTRPETII
jgi:hypothetical protein